MTVTLTRSGRPTALHERRAATLCTMAILSGHTTRLTALSDGTRPDVLQLRPMDGDLFIGDAKATETPGNTETYERLSHYAVFLEGWLRAGGTGLMALAVADTHAADWLRVLRALCLRMSGGIRVPGRIDRVDNATTVVWRTFTGRNSANPIEAVPARRLDDVGQVPYGAGRGTTTTGIAFTRN